MKIRTLTAAGLLFMAVPAWAHCGKCGVGDSKGSETKDQEQKKGHYAHAHGHDHEHAEIGKPAPDFTLKDTEGQAHKLSDLKGKVVVLEWTNHECPFVQRHHGDKGTVAKSYAKFKANEDVAWLAIDSSHFCEEKRESISSWAKEAKLGYPILLDAAGEVGHIYGAKTTPHVFVINQKGVLAYMGAPDDDAHGAKDDPRNYIVDAVDALLKGSAVETARSRSYGCTVKYKK